MTHPFHRGTILMLVLLSLLVCSHARAGTLAERVREHTFANGLKLLVVERHTSPTFAAYISIGVGAVDEDSSTRGVAHLLEHMLFKGTETIGTRDYRQEKPILEEIARVGGRIDALKNDPKADSAELERLRRRLAELQQRHRPLVVKDEFSRIYGENGGVGYNAFTSKDTTTYTVQLPANRLELWARLEADRMRNPVLREFYTEREVIKEERRRSYDSRPSGMLYETLLANAFTVHPYRNPIIGWPSDIDNLTLEETESFLHRYYAPVNTVIALVGDVEFDHAVDVVGLTFGTIPAGTPVPPVIAVEPPQRGEKRVEIRFDAEPRLAIAFHKPTLPAKDDYIFDLIDLILGQGRVSRLYREVVEKRQLAAGISTYGAPGARYDNLFVISATPRKPHTVEEVEQAIMAELERLRSTAVSDSEIERALNRLRADHLRSMRSNAGLARSLTYYQLVAGDWRYLDRYGQVVSTLTAEDVRRVAEEYFRPENRTVVILRRQGEVR
ncbi:MAG: pitrilysin family protein [Geothermobacteraceae bacterium]